MTNKSIFHISKMDCALETYKIFPSESFYLCNCNIKFLVVSKTINGKDTLIIFANAKTRHSAQLYAWMKDNDLIDATRLEVEECQCLSKRT